MTLLIFIALLVLPAVVRAETHYFKWTTKYKQSMFMGVGCTDEVFLKHCEDSYMAYHRDGVLYYRNSSLNTGEIGVELRVPDDANVLTMDGFYRSTPTINGQVPGPAIEVTEGDTVVVELTNEFENEATALHFHGMYQRGTPWMDGVSAVTQCGVLPFETFTYEFVAEPAGTHMWHAHHGVERPDGLYGPLIVHPKAGPSATRRSVLGEDGHEDVLTLTIQDHEASETMYTQRDGAGWYPDGPDGKPSQWTRDVSGKLVGEMPFSSGLINGRGRFSGTDNGGSAGADTTPLTVFRSAVGIAHVFRLVASQESLALRVSVDNHELVAFASDGAEFVPRVVESVIVHPGETFDIAVTPTVAGRFWVRAETLEIDVDDAPRSALAVLIVSEHDGREERSGMILEEDPTTTRRECTGAAPCVVLNCPFPKFGAPEANTECLMLDAMRDAEPDAHPPCPAGEPDVQLFLNFVFEPAINNRRFVFPEAPPLTQPDTSGAVACDDDVCDFAAFPGQPCECTHTRDLPFNKTVELVFTNVGGSGFGYHPVHLHGHHFYVLAMGYPPHDEESGRVCVFYEGDDHPTCSERDDVDCVSGTGCGVAAWKVGRAPVLNFDRPPLKDTVVVPPGGWTVVRFRTDNPGLWHLHCHMAHHLESGMGMLINEAPEYHGLFPAPAGFPTCGSLHDSAGLDADVARSRAEYFSLMGEVA